MTVRVVVADDQELVRDGLSMVLDAHDGIEVVGTAADGVEAVELVRRLVPDVALVDVRMPRLDGIQATRRIVASGCPTRVVVLTTFDLDEYVLDAIRAGASGFLLKDLPRAQLVSAVRSVVTGDVVLAPAVTVRLVEQLAGRHRRPDPRLDLLSARERDVLRLIARGMSNAEIAEHLTVEVTTVKTHVARLLARLGVRDRVQAVVFAFEAGVVDPGPPPAASPWNSRGATPPDH